VSVCRVAAEKGDVQTLQCLRGMYPPCPWDETVTTAAAGNLEMLKVLRAFDPPCPWDSTLCRRACMGRHWDVLAWARVQVPPCPWDMTVCSRAAGRGDVEAVQILRVLTLPRPGMPV